MFTLRRQIFILSILFVCLTHGHKYNGVARRRPLSKHEVTPSSENEQPDHGIAEEQANFFQDFYSVQLSPHKMEFGHVCEDPNNWEQRYESKDYKNHRDMGKVRWGDKQGGYGEHYWDYNHAGYGGDQTQNVPDEETTKTYKEGNIEDQSNLVDQGTVVDQGNVVDQSKIHDHDTDHDSELDHDMQEEKVETEQNDEHKAYEVEDLLKHTFPQNKAQKVALPEKLMEKPQNNNDNTRRITYEDVDAPTTQASLLDLLKELATKESTSKTRRNDKRYNQNNEHLHQFGIRKKVILSLDPTSGRVVDKLTGQSYILLPVD